MRMGSLQASIQRIFQAFETRLYVGLMLLDANIYERRNPLSLDISLWVHQGVCSGLIANQEAGR